MIDQRPKPRIIPVLDVMNGVVVHAIAGRRSEYRPIASKLTDSTSPIEVGQALLTATGATELYVADLDAITGTGLISLPVGQFVYAGGFPCWIDAGVPNYARFLSLPFFSTVRLVVATETCPGLNVLAEIIENGMAGNLAFSLDLKAGKLLGNWEAWGAAHAGDAIAVARTAISLGVRTLIVLDLARVGTGLGSGTTDLLRAIRDEFPEVELIAGGGVKTWGDVDALGEAGADAVLVASALHDGTLTFPRPVS